MNSQDFKKSSAGWLTTTISNSCAFVPNHLPPPIKYDAHLVTLLGEAEAGLGALRGAGNRLPNPHLLIMPYLRQEAVLSSKIEGTVTTLSELFRFEAESKSDPGNEDLRQVKNYVTALENGLEALNVLPLSLRLVKTLHADLMTGVHGNQQDAGNFRRNQNWIGYSGAPIADATFVPPPIPEMSTALADWEKFLHVRDDVPVLVQCAMLHYQFEAIHPFIDGNGRVGRLLIILFLCERRRLEKPLLYLSAYFERNRSEYYERLLEVSRSGDWVSWIEFFLRGIVVESTKALNHSEKILALHSKYREIIQPQRGSARILAVLDKLFENPYITVRRTVDITKTTPTTAQKIIDRLLTAKILTEITGGKWGRVYCAKKLLRILSSAPDQVGESDSTEPGKP